MLMLPSHHSASGSVDASIHLVPSYHRCIGLATRVARLDFGKHKMVQGGKYPSLLQIGAFSFCRAAVGAGDWRLCCRAQDSDARDICQLFFGRSLFYMSYCGAIFSARPIYLSLGFCICLFLSHWS